MEDLNSEFDAEDLNRWLDQFSLSRPRRNVNKDFSDGVLIAEIIHFYFPKMVDIHNYTPANGVIKKKSNWETLNRKVLCKLNCRLSPQQIGDILSLKLGVMENFIAKLKRVLEDASVDPRNSSNSNYRKGTSDFHGDNGTQVERNQFGNADAFDMNGLSYVPAALLADKDKEIEFLKETLDMLQLRVNRLESLLQLKETRIHDLTERLKMNY